MNRRDAGGDEGIGERGVHMKGWEMKRRDADEGME